jgi:hypothetical protein
MPLKRRSAVALASPFNTVVCCCNFTLVVRCFARLSVATNTFGPLGPGLPLIADSGLMEGTLPRRSDIEWYPMNRLIELLKTTAAV